ncbi:hypothetical protein, partial [Clostridium paraputrificum]|uniref:hypothetical protein n=1 Tax=Clostridium paraputrificum TaxID=29363 RepID=UPI001A9A5FF3
ILFALLISTYKSVSLIPLFISNSLSIEACASVKLLPSNVSEVHTLKYSLLFVIPSGSRVIFTSFLSFVYKSNVLLFSDLPTLKLIHFHHQD